MFRRILALCGGFAALCLPVAGQTPPSPAGTMRVYQTRLIDGAGNAISGVTVCARAVSGGKPISVRVGGSGVTVTRPVCSAVTNGAWSLFLPDGATSGPQNVKYALTAIDDATGDNLLAGYGGVQPSSVAPTGTSEWWCTPDGCNLNSLSPDAPSQALVVSGPAGPQGTPGCSGGGCATTLSVTPSADQVVTQASATSMTVNKQNGQVYNVRAWCTIPHVLDDTCFRNAINDAFANGFLGYQNHRYAELVVSPETYYFHTPVTIPSGLNIGIHGTVQSGLYGATINTDNSDAFIVQSDNVDIKNLSFFGTPSTSGVTYVKHQGIVLGTSTISVFDTHINWCWFFNQSNAIHAVNASGLDLSHTTWDSGTTYGVYSDMTAGDVQLRDVIATSVRGFNEYSVFFVHGDGTDAYSDIIVDGIFDTTQAGGTALSFNAVRSLKITGDFNANPYDIALTGVNGASIGPFVGHNNYLQSIVVAHSNDIDIHDGAYVNTGLGLTTSTGALIAVGTSNRVAVHGMHSLSTNGTPTGNVLNGLVIDSASTESSVYDNHFTAQTGAAEAVADVSSYLPATSLKVTGSLVNGTGLQHTRQTGCTTGTTAGAFCTVDVTWPVPLSDGQYSWTCSAEAVSGGPIINGAIAKTSTKITLEITNLLSSSSSAVGLLDCWAAHD